MTKRKKPGRVKWEPAAAMVAVALLGVWLVYSLGTLSPEGLDPDATTAPLRIGNERGVVEITGTPDEQSYRLLFRSGETVGPMSRDAFTERFGERTTDAIDTTAANPLFKLFNITSYGALIWIAIGFGGQIAFFGRMAIQWIVSERERKSVVPDAFWYLSFAGGLALFTYFVWRQDIVGVTGQTTGVVIYARNIRLIHKQKRRERRLADKAAAATDPPSADPAPNPGAAPPSKGDLHADR